MNKVVISGYYGFNNIGDESILTAIISNLKDGIEDIDITVLSKDPILTHNKHGVNAISRKNVFKITREIKKCDLLISGGGSLLQDVTSNRSIVYYLSIILIGILCGKKTMIYSQGIGPINNPINKFLTRKILDKVDYMTLRDKRSKKVLEDMKIENQSIIVAADPVIGLKKRDLKIGKEILVKSNLSNTTKPIIGFALRGRNRDENLINVISKVSDDVIERIGASVVFIPFHYGEDINTLNEIEKNMKNKAIFLREKYELDEMLSIVGNLDLLIGIRLHSLIFSAIMNIPMIAISYDPKVDYFMESINEPVFCNIEELNRVSLMKEIDEKLNNKDEYRARLEEEVLNSKKKLVKNREVVKQLLNKDC